MTSCMPSGPDLDAVADAGVLAREPERARAQRMPVLAEPRDPAAAAHEPRLLARGVEVQVGVVRVGRHLVLREHEPVRAHVAHVARRRRRSALAALVQRQVGEVADRRRALGGRRRQLERSERGVRLVRVRLSAGDQRGPSQNCPVRGSSVMFVREPSATTSTVSPSSPATSVCASPFDGMPEHVVDPDRVRARVARPGRLVAQAAAGEDEERLVLVGVAVRRRRALARGRSRSARRRAAARRPPRPSRRRVAASSPRSQRSGGTSSTWIGAPAAIHAACQPRAGVSGSPRRPPGRRRRRSRPCSASSPGACRRGR